MNELEFRAHTEAVIAALEAADLLVGDHQAPQNVAIGWQPDDTFIKYVVVYRIDGGSRSGSLEVPFGDAVLVYQIQCIAGSSRSAEWLASKVDAALVAGISVSGRRIHVVPDGTPGGPRQDEVTPPIFTATPRFRLMSTPSSEEVSA